MSQFNAWIAINLEILHLALNMIIMIFSEILEMYALANYQFNNWFGATFKYHHEDLRNTVQI